MNYKQLIMTIVVIGMVAISFIVILCPEALTVSWADLKQ